MDWDMPYNCQKSIHWVYVCKKNPLPHPAISAIPVQLYQENNLVETKTRQVYCQYTNILVFQAGEGPLFSFVNTAQKNGIIKNGFSKDSLRIPSVNVNKSSGISGFGKIYWRNP